MDRFWPAAADGLKEVGENNRRTSKSMPIRNSVFSQQSPQET